MREAGEKVKGERKGEIMRKFAIIQIIKVDQISNQ
jgi:hypothetical protein